MHPLLLLIHIKAVISFEYYQVYPNNQKLKIVAVSFVIYE